MQAVKRETGYFLGIDMLGFSNIVKNNDLSFLDKRINAWVSLIERSAIKHSIIDYQLISDTIFVKAGKEKSDLKNLIQFARTLLEDGIIDSFPIRGAITFGDFFWGSPLVYGKAVIDAHNLEKQQNWLGIIIDNKISLDIKDYLDLGLILYPTPMASNYNITLFPAIFWNIPEIEILVMKLMEGGLTIKGEQLNWKWGDKLTNTTTFSLYSQLLRKNNLPPEKFTSLLPIHPISTELNKAPLF